MGKKNEGQWYDEILERMLSAALEKGLDIRESSVSYQLYAPVAAELAACYVQGELADDNSFVDTADLAHLILRAKERGVDVLDAQSAKLQAEIVAEGAVPTGERFSDGQGHIYVVTADEGEGLYELTSEEAGVFSLPEPGEALSYLGYRCTVKSAAVQQVTDGGRNAETADQLRARYYESLRALPFGGNGAEYRERALSLPGVGGVRVKRTWNGAGTVKLLLLGSGGVLPDEQTVQAVQEYFDPIAQDGSRPGTGAAPIGHEVTVTAADGETVSVKTYLATEEGVSPASLQGAAAQALQAYFAEVAQTWAKNEKAVLRVGRVESALASIPGVLEAYDTLLNGEGASRLYDGDAVPVLGEVELLDGAL